MLILLMSQSQFRQVTKNLFLDFNLSFIFKLRLLSPDTWYINELKVIDKQENADVKPSNGIIKSP